MIFSHGVKLAGTASLLALSALGAAAPALAQDAADAVSAPTGLHEIGVTAQTREPGLPDAPVCLVALEARQRAELKGNTIRSNPGFVHNLSVQSTRGTPGGSELHEGAEGDN